jgi:hypothetical protein
MLTTTNNGGKEMARLARGLFLGGIICLCLTAAVNYSLGDTLAVTTAGKWLSSLSSVVVDIVGLVLFGRAAGACWAAGRWKPALVFTVVMLASAAWSATAMVSFAANERLSAAASREKAITRADDLDSFSKNRVTWLQGEALRVGTRTERRDFLKASGEEVSRLRDAPTKTFLLPDAGATVIADWTGWKVERVQISLVSYVSLLLIVLQAVAFPASSFLGYLAHQSAPANPPKGDVSGPGRGEETRKQPCRSTATVETFPRPKRTPVRMAEASVPTIMARNENERLPLDLFLQEQLARGVKLASQLELSRRSGWSPGAVSKKLRRLEREGKITRHRDGNRKTVLVCIGDGGARQAIAIR